MKENKKFIFILFELILDIIIIAFTLYFIYSVIVQGDSNRNITFNNLFALFILILSSIFIFISRKFNISIFRKNLHSVILRGLLSLNFVILLSVFMFFIMKENLEIYYLMIAIICISSNAAYIICKSILYLILKKRIIKTSLIIGPSGEVNDLLLKSLSSSTIKIEYIIYDCFSNTTLKEITQYLKMCDTVFICEGLGKIYKDELISYCYEIRKQFYLVPNIHEIAIRNANPTSINDILLYEVSSYQLTLEQRFIKRVFDIIVSSFMLLALFPFMFVIGLLIYFNDKGPIFFRQKRVTYHSKVFSIIKFRTMIVDAEKTTGAIQASLYDNRITRIGKYLRKTRIDELPQLFNVLRGDLSLVGPRALRVEEVNEFTSNDRQFNFRFNVKAGITGVAQTLGNYSTKAKDKLRFDMFYISNYSFSYDLIILFATLKSLFDFEKSKGVYDEDISISDVLVKLKYDIQEIDEGFIYKILEKR